MAIRIICKSLPVIQTKESVPACWKKEERDQVHINRHYGTEQTEIPYPVVKDYFPLLEMFGNASLQRTQSHKKHISK